jgi:hypothetical protein
MVVGNVDAESGGLSELFPGVGMALVFAAGQAQPDLKPLRFGPIGLELAWLLLGLRRCFTIHGPISL